MPDRTAYSMGGGLWCDCQPISSSRPSNRYRRSWERVCLLCQPTLDGYAASLWQPRASIRNLGCRTTISTCYFQLRERLIIATALEPVFRSSNLGRVVPPSKRVTLCQSPSKRVTLCHKKMTQSYPKNNENPYKIRAVNRGNFVSFNNTY